MYLYLIHFLLLCFQEMDAFPEDIVVGKRSSEEENHGHCSLDDYTYTGTSPRGLAPC